jgi:hypothetical protein
MVTFMSKSAASFIMTDAVARSVIEASGSDWSDPGAIAFYQRLAPVLEMLRAAQADQKPVVWERS